MYQKFGSSVRKTAKVLISSKRNTEKGGKISKSTVQNYLKTTSWGKKAFKSSKKCFLSEKNLQDRRKFGGFMEKSGNFTPEIRGEKLILNIFFTDESWIELHR